MCTIDKMLIKGIRSFSPENKTLIEFSRPLTLIVGANGAGKTTIIECLKQACTGELPPNTRSGQSFVHDPKVAHETEVKALIKMRFFTSTGQAFVVSRMFQLTQKKTKLEFKSIDCTLATKNVETGKDTAITYRCVDMDKVVPGLMGVSKAVLESVIFVHQEDSNWPLAEGKVLKERFDDIFAATKYTKALESLRKLKTEKMHQIKEMKLTLDHLRTHRDNAARLQEQVERAQEQINKHQQQAEDLERQVQDKVAEVEMLHKQLDQLRQLTRDVQVANARLEELSKQAAIKASLLQDKEFVESAEELKEMLMSFEATVEQEKMQLSRLTREISMQRQELSSQQEKHSKAIKRHSVLAAEKAAHDANVAERDRFVRDSAARLGLPLGAGAADQPLSELVAVAFAADLKRHTQEAESALKACKETSRRRDEEMSKEVDELNAKVTAHHEHLRIRRDQIKGNTRTIESLQAQAEAMVVNETLAVDAQKRMQVADDQLQARIKEQAQADLDAKLMREKRELDELETRISELRQERDRQSSSSEALTRLRLKEQDLALKKEALNVTVRLRRAKALQLLGTADLPAVDQLRPRCEAVLEARRRELAAQQATLQRLQAEESDARAQLSASRAALQAAEAHEAQALAQLRAELPTAHPGVGVVLEPGQAVDTERLLEAALHQRKTAMDECQQKLMQQEMMCKYFRGVRDLMCSTKQCPACYRAFASEDEMSNSIMQLDEDSRNWPAKAQRLTTQLEAAKAAHSGLLCLQPIWRKVVDLETREIRGLRDKIRPLEESLSSVSAGAQESAEMVAISQMEYDEAKQLVQEAVWQIDRQNAEVGALQQEVDQMQAAVTASQAAQGGRSLSELDDEIEKAELDKRQKELARENTQRRQNRLKEQILQATRELSDARDVLNQSRQRIDRKSELLSKVADLEAASRTLQGEIVQQEREGAPLAEQRDQAATLRTQTRGVLQSDIDRHELALRSALQLQDIFQAKAQPIHEYEARQAGMALARATLAVEEANAAVTCLANEISSKEAEARERSQRVSEQESLRHHMQDALELHNLKTQLANQEQRIRALVEEQHKVGSEAQLLTRLRASEAERSELKQRLDMLKGNRQAQEQNMQHAHEQLKAKEFKNIVLRYNEHYASVIYTEMANNDLDKYQKALEKALLVFHTTKMADINKIIKELWQKTYRGQDIDYIQIKADADGLRSYNYRVVMYSGGAELEMRGRCSAGQKVLACLIIRLALAETFCLNCGILALDEPTTNLDAENALSLAEALRAIMVARRDQENFQLIVITHDENFAHQIGTREQAEYLWRVTKDENQHSHLSKEAIE